MFILFLFVSFVSFRQCKVTAISDCFQGISPNLCQLVWTNERSLDISQKWAKKLSKHSFFTVFFCIFAHYNNMVQKSEILEFPQAKGIVVSGDIHGDITPLVFKCCVQYGMTDTLIIVAGDCGFGFERPGYYEDIYKRCREKLSKANNWLVFIRGNHDNPAYFNSLPIKHQRWMTLPDYSVIKACGHTILCVGGATSIDRTFRMASKQYHLPNPQDLLMPNVYWSNEEPVLDRKKLDDIDGRCAVDTVITHTSPSFCELSSHHFLDNWIEQDEELLDDIKSERQAMDDIYNYLYSKNHPLRYWYYGHFHESWHAKIEDVMYHMLDIMELREIPLV